MKKTRSFILAAVLLLVGNVLPQQMMLSAQSITAVAMKASTVDLSASANPRRDANDAPCALVKVSLTVPNATFGGNVVGDVARDGSDYWVYMINGSKMLQVKHPNFKTLMVNFADLGVNRVQGKTTYLLDLAVPYVAPIEASSPAAPAQSAVNAAPLQTSVDAAPEQPAPKPQFKQQKIKDYMGAFFPVYGLTLGKSTLRDANRIGYQLEDADYGKAYDMIKVQGANFWADKKDFGDAYRRITFSVMGHNSVLPKDWKEQFGFDETFSYREWYELMTSLGFRVDVVDEPKIVVNFRNEDMLVAKLNAVSPDGLLGFEFEFEYGHKGTTPDSKETLWSMTAFYLRNEKLPQNRIKATKGKAPHVKQSKCIDEFFPVYGLTLGKSTWYDMQQNGFPMAIAEDGGNNASVNGMAWWDFDETGIYDSFYITYSDPLPAAWVRKGLQFGNSYNTMIDFFEGLGYTIVVNDEPREVPQEAETGCFRAKITAVSPDAHLKFELNFNYSKGGRTRSAANTLYSITCRAQ